MASTSVSHLCAAHGRQSLYFTMGSFPPKLPLPMGDLDHHLTHCSMGPLEPRTQTASRSVQPFLQGSLQSIPIPYNGPPLTPKLAPSVGNSGPPPNTWFLWPTRVLNPNSITNNSTIFAGLTTVTDRPTDRPHYLVSNNRPHLHT